MPAEKIHGRYWVPKCDVCGSTRYIHDGSRSRRACEKVARDVYGWSVDRGYFVCPDCGKAGYVPVVSRSLRDVCKNCPDCGRPETVTETPRKDIQIRLGNRIVDIPEKLHMKLCDFLGRWFATDRLDRDDAECVVANLESAYGLHYDPADIIDHYDRVMGDD